VFASNSIDLVEMPETYQNSKEGEWTPETCGGKR